VDQAEKGEANDMEDGTLTANGFLFRSTGVSLEFQNFWAVNLVNFSKAVPNCQRIAKEMGSLLGFELI